MLFVQTGNHHLFIVIQPWIILLGKRKLHFPFFGTRFENATFYNIPSAKLYHLAEGEMQDLTFDLGETWNIEGKRPLEFSLSFRPTLFQKRSIFLNTIRFQYNLLTLSNGQIGSEILTQGQGISEQGTLLISTHQKLQVPFCYHLFLETQGQGGLIDWKADPKHTPFFLRFLKDRFQWGNMDKPKTTETLATTVIPLKNWTLNREIVKGFQAGNTYYGLKESFDFKTAV